QAVKLRPGAPISRYFLGLAYGQSENYAKAESEFNAAIQADNTFLLAYVPLAQLKLSAGDAEAAIRDSKQALADVTRSQAHLILAKAYTSLKDFNSAAVELDNFMKKNPGSAAGMHEEGLLFLAQGNYPKAQAAFEAALKASPDNVDSLT